MKYQLQYFQDLRFLTTNQALADPKNERLRNRCRVCLVCVDSEVGGASYVADGQLVHRMAYDGGHVPGASNCPLLGDLFGIEGVEAVWPQPYRVAVLRADLAGGGWPSLVPKVLSVLQQHLGGELEEVLPDEEEESPVPPSPTSETVFTEDDFEDEDCDDPSCPIHGDPAVQQERFQELLGELPGMLEQVMSQASPVKQEQLRAAMTAAVWYRASLDPLYPVLVELLKRLSPLVLAMRGQEDFKPSELPKFPRLGEKEVLAIAAAVGFAAASTRITNLVDFDSK